MIVINLFLEFINQIDTTILTIFEACFIILCLLMTFYFFKLEGLYIYISAMFIVCNIQVMKASYFFFINDPVPLGTTAYGSIAIAISIIVEFYGLKYAKRALLFGLLANALFMIMMIFTIGYKPLDSDITDEMLFLRDNHYHIQALFSPLPSIIIGSMSAYYFSGYLLSILQNYLKSKFANNDSKIALVLRTYFADSMAAFVDLLIMNYLVWYVFAESSMTIGQIFISYIISAYPFRILTAAISIPTLIIARKLWKKELK